MNTDLLIKKLFPRMTLIDKSQGIMTSFQLTPLIAPILAQFENTLGSPFTFSVAH